MRIDVIQKYVEKYVPETHKKILACLNRRSKSVAEIAEEINLGKEYLAKRMKELEEMSLVYVFKWELNKYGNYYPKYKAGCKRSAEKPVKESLTDDEVNERYKDWCGKDKRKIEHKIYGMWGI